MSEIPDILKKIVETKKKEIEKLALKTQSLIREAINKRSPLDFKEAIAGSQGIPTVIAEVKKASPSAGIISSKLEPSLIAKEYELGRADAISVLTDKEYFKGNISYLERVKDVVSIPVLRKDFIISKEQIFEGRSAGADSFLLIAAILSTEQLSDFIKIGREFGMEPLVEVHDEADLTKALDAGAEIIGINNRNLRDFTVDIQNAVRLIPLIPNSKIIVAESGILSLKSASTLYKAGANSLLIGEFLMKSANKSQLIQEIKKARNG